MQRLKWSQWVTLFIFASMGVSFVYTVFKVFHAPLKQEVSGQKAMLRGDYIFLLFEIVLGIIILALPSILARRFKFEIPGLVYLLFVIFLYGSIYLGTIQKFYDLFPRWDKILHTFSGAMLGAIGFSFVNILNNDEHVVMKMKAGFVAVFSFCFAVTLGIFWEVYEFIFDNLLHLNMQRHSNLEGMPLRGKWALMDTMTDIIVDVIGSFLIAIIGYFSLKKGRPWMRQFAFKRKNEIN